MDMNPRTVRGLFELCTAAQVDRATLEAPFTDDERARFAGKGPLDWPTFVRVLDRLFFLCDHDPDRFRDLGRQVHRIPSQSFLTKLARHVGSLRHLYEAGRWSATNDFPHLEMTMEHGTDEVKVIGRIPAPHPPCVALHYILQGALTELPRLMALEPARIKESRVEPHYSMTVLGIPRHHSLVSRLVRRVDSALHAAEMRDLYEDQRRELSLAVHRLESAAGELRAVLEALPDPVFLLREGNIAWANRTAGCILGIDSNELVGRTFPSIVHPLDRARLDVASEAPASVNVSASERSAASAPGLAPLRMVSSSGELVEMELSAQKTVSFEGATATLVVARDVSERMRLQQRMVMVDRLASIGTLAAGVAHEVNNPLSYVLWNLDVVGRALGVRTALTQDGHDALVIVREGIDRVRTVVRDLRALARPDENTLEPIDVHAILETTLSLTASELSSRVQVVRAYDRKIPRVHANGARLGQIFLNLILNASAAMEGQPRSHATLTLRTTQQDGGLLAIDVSDTGSGIADDIVGRIFDPFFTSKPFGRGTGLGLTISQRIASEIGGDLQLASTSERGTTFRVHLPCADEHS